MVYPRSVQASLDCGVFPALPTAFSDSIRHARHTRKAPVRICFQTPGTTECVYICIYVYMYTDTPTIHTYTYIYIYTCTYLHVHIHIYIHACVCIYIYAHRSLLTYTDIYTYEYLHKHQRIEPEYGTVHFWTR